MAVDREFVVYSLALDSPDLIISSGPQWIDRQLAQRLADAQSRKAGAERPTTIENGCKTLVFLRF